MVSQTELNTFEMLIAAGKETLEAILQNGERPQLGDLAGHEYNGYSTWFPTKPLQMAKFTKGFLWLFPKSPVEIYTERVGVYNIPTEMNALNKGWVHKRGNDGQRLHFGYGDVYPACEDRLDDKYKNSLLINYGLNPENSKHPVRNFRDYIVCAVGDDPTVLVGKSLTVFNLGLGKITRQHVDMPELGGYFVDGALRAMPNYFMLIKAGKSDSEMKKYFSNYKQTTRKARK